LLDVGRGVGPRKLISSVDRVTAARLLRPLGYQGAEVGHANRARGRERKCTVCKHGRNCLAVAAWPTKSVWDSSRIFHSSKGVHHEIAVQAKGWENCDCFYLSSGENATKPPMAPTAIMNMQRKKAPTPERDALHPYSCMASSCPMISPILSRKRVVRESLEGIQGQTTRRREGLNTRTAMSGRTKFTCIEGPCGSHLTSKGLIPS